MHPGEDLEDLAGDKRHRQHDQDVRDVLLLLRIDSPSSDELVGQYDITPALIDFGIGPSERGRAEHSRLLSRGYKMPNNIFGRSPSFSLDEVVNFLPCTSSSAVGSSVPPEWG